MTTVARASATAVATPSSIAGASAEWEGAGKFYPSRPGSPLGVWAVRGVDLQARPGEVLGLIGPNRAGKTTLVKLLLSLCSPTEGRARRFGLPARQRGTLGRVGYVPAENAFPLDMTANTILQYYGALTLLPPALVRARARTLLADVGLDDRAREPISRFSKGMLQRLALAQALLNEPNLLVLDEPAEGLDQLGRSLLRRVVGDCRRRGAAVVLISHALSEVERLCDRVAVLVAGRKVFDGTLEALTTESLTGATVPLDLALARLTGEPLP